MSHLPRILALILVLLVLQSRPVEGPDHGAAETGPPRVVLGPAPAHAAEPARRTENVIIITWDGFRWQDFFGGADESLVDAKMGGVRDLDGLRRRYGRETASERRQVLLPFMWGTVAKQGQIFGDPLQKAAARSTNGLKFSYPGYSELFCGFPDERIDANARKNNPNLSVFEFLNDKPAYQGKVAAFCTWDIFPFILRSETNNLKVQAGWVPVKDEPLTGRQKQANEQIARLPRIWPDNTFDMVTMDLAREHLVRHKPRVLYIGLGETDEWGHGRRYDLYLDAAHKADQFTADLWKTLQELPQYRDKTTLLVTTDHGRGGTRVDWTDHGKKIDGAEFIWMAVLGPDTPARGVRENVEVTQGQIAATIAGLLGEDFAAASPKAAAVLPEVGAQPRKR